VGELPNPDWMNQWQALARQYAGAWQDAARGGAPMFATPSPQQGFEQWSRMFAGGGAQGETIERVIDSAKGYGAFLQAMLGASSAPGDASSAWSEAMRSVFAGSTNLFDHPATRAWQGTGGQGNEAMTQFLAMANALRSPSATNDELKGWLNLPAFGLLREHQEHYQKGALAWLDYQEQMRRYSALMMKAAQRGFELFEGKLSEREQPGRQIDSLRALYDLWVDAAEEGYAEIALSGEFRETYGALVNAQMRVRSQIQQEVERVATDLGMPTRSEINSIGERLQALRREVRAREAGADSELADQIATLRAEFSAFKRSAEGRRAGSSGVAAAATPAPPAPARKPRARASTLPVRKPKRKATPAGKSPRAVAATAAGNFASRIASFADASHDTRRTLTPKTKRKDAAPKRGKKR
jgi:polyhydroxyalkanoate synthase subunit PhaE